MPTQSSPRYELYFDDPRLRMTLAGRMLVRVSGWIGYVFLVVLIFLLLLQREQGIVWARIFGFFLLIFLLDMLIHRADADRLISESPPGGVASFGLPASGRANVARYVAPAAFSYLEDGFDRSTLTRRNFFLETVRQLLKSREVQEGVVRLDIDPKELDQKAEELLGSDDGKSTGVKEDMLVQAEQLAVAAFSRALENGHKFVDAGDLFSALSQVDDGITKRLFNVFSIDAGDLDRALLFGMSQRSALRPGKIPVQIGGFILESYKPVRHRVMNRAWTSRPTPTLDSVGRDFTDLARQENIGFLVGHKEEYERMVDTIARLTNPNVLLVGQASIGKEAIVGHLALQIAKDKVPPPLFDKRLVELHLSNLVAGASAAELQNRLKKIIEEIFLAGNIILYIPDIHNLVKTSGEAYLSAADALMPIIKDNLFPIIGASYPKEFKEFLEPRGDFLGSFEVIHVKEISEAEAEKILVYESMILERQYGILISFGAIKKAVAVSKKYLRTKLLPASAEELLKDAVVEAKRLGEKSVGPGAIVKAAEKKVNVPIHEATEAESKALLNLEDIIHERFIDQEDAVKVIANSLREYRSGLARKGGPIAAFLFVGPTGVGKTELSKILARIQFGSESLMVRFDMSEYQDKQSLFRFIGSPDGKQSGALTDAVLQKPYSLILLDEFEKANPDILNLFLQVFDDGRLTDSLNRVVNFENTIIIATSNAHSDIMIEALRHGESMASISEYLKSKLTDIFRAELLNRFSRIVVFRDLALKDVARVAELNLRELAATIAEQGIKLEWEDAAVQKIASLGYDPSFGARPLRRVIEEKIRAPLAEKLLRKEIMRGVDVRIVLSGEELQLIHVAQNAQGSEK